MYDAHVFGPVTEPNRHRVTADGVSDANFGVVRIDWSAPEPQVTLEVRDTEGQLVLNHAVPLTALRPAPSWQTAVP